MARVHPRIPPPQEQEPVFTYQGSTPEEVPLEIARIHHHEAQQLFDRAFEAEVEGRVEEARLLTDLATAREATAVDFERVAHGESKDPIVEEILDWQEDIAEHFVPYQSSYVPPPEEPKPEEPKKRKTPSEVLLGFVAWVGGLIA
jgi:hypothetical protein